MAVRILGASSGIRTPEVPLLRSDTSFLPLRSMWCPGFDESPCKVSKNRPTYGGAVFWCLVGDSLFCGKATAVATVHRTVAKSRLSNPRLKGKVSKKHPANGGVLFWCLVGDSNPGHPA